MNKLGFYQPICGTPVMTSPNREHYKLRNNFHSISKSCFLGIDIAIGTSGLYLGMMPVESEDEWRNGSARCRCFGAQSIPRPVRLRENLNNVQPRRHCYLAISDRLIRGRRSAPAYAASSPGVMTAYQSKYRRVRSWRKRNKST